MRKLLLLPLFLFSGFIQAQQLDSLDIKIGQMLIVGINGTAPDAAILEDIKNGKVGGIILFEKNIASSNSYVTLKQTTWSLQKAAPSIPLLIAIDQEGGKVNRLKEKYNFPRSVTAEYLGNNGNLDSTAFYAEITAATLAGLGINMNFAPVVDLSSFKDNPIIAKYGRAYSDNPDSVALHAAEVVKAHQKYGVVSVLKHFPGHGSSHDDSHLGIADVTKYWQKNELDPYKTLFNQLTIDGVMTAHIVNKTLEPSGLPGTLSGLIVTNLLRDQLQYNGVVFSDDMQMHAITKYYGLENSIKLAILAGVNMLIFSNNIQNSEIRTVDNVHQIIKKLVQKGEIPMDYIESSYRSIINLKRTRLQ